MLFQPTRPLRDATFHCRPHVQSKLISTHASLAGRDICRFTKTIRAAYFNPRVPCGTRHFFAIQNRAEVLFQPTRPLRDATYRVRAARCKTRISTHASLAGRDMIVYRGGAAYIHFNPRVPCGTRRRGETEIAQRLVFQPTRPLRDATKIKHRANACNRFQPTRPLRDATMTKRFYIFEVDISTHASLAGRDRNCQRMREYHQHFNPRVPCGTRRFMLEWSNKHEQISTHASLAGRDAKHIIWVCMSRISTHASLAGRDFNIALIASVLFYFNPRVPCGTRQPFPIVSMPAGLISTHASLAGRDQEALRQEKALKHFNPRVPCGTRHGWWTIQTECYHFNPRVPCGTRHFRYLFSSDFRIISTHASLAGRDRPNSTRT